MAVNHRVAGSSPARGAIKNSVIPEGVTEFLPAGQDEKAKSADHREEKQPLLHQDLAGFRRPVSKKGPEDRVLPGEPVSSREHKFVLWLSVPIEVKVEKKGSRNLYISARKIAWSLEALSKITKFSGRI